MFDDGQCVHLVQELLRGDELLDKALMHTNFTERDASDIMCALTKTVEYLHSQGVSWMKGGLKNQSLNSGGAVQSQCHNIVHIHCQSPITSEVINISTKAVCWELQWQCPCSIFICMHIIKA